MGTTRSLFLAAMTASALAATACGSGGGGGGGGSNLTAGVGTISITSFSPNPILGCAPTPFTITGTNFQDVTGTTAIIKFTASTGAPFGGNAVATVIGSVTGPTTITGVSPEVTLCGIPSVTVTVDVTLESGVSTATTGTGVTITINGSTLITFSPNPVPAAIPTAFTITGTGFTPGPVTVRFVSANLGDLNFVNGTSDSVDIAATATTTTTITGETPVARALGANFTSSVQVILPDGCCTPPTAPTFLTWLTPVITSAAFSTVSATVPGPIVVTGTNLGVPGETGTIRLTQFPTPPAGGPPFGPIFSNASASTIDIPGVVGGGGTSFTFQSPVVSICDLLPNGSPGTLVANSSMLWTAPRGGSTAAHPSGTSAVTFNVPTITSITTPTVPALVATPFSITLSAPGFNFLGPITARLTSTSAGTPSIFADGTRTTIDIALAPTSATTAAGITPIATLCGIDTATASMTVFFPGGSCVTSSLTLLTFQAPALTAASPGGIQNPNMPVAAFPNNNMFALAGKEQFVLNAAAGRSFGTIGSFVEVRFSTAGNLNWQGGTRDFDTVVGQVATATTITGTTPATSSTSLGILSVAVQALFEDGSCTNSTTAQFTQTSNRTFIAATGGFATFNTSGTGAIAAPTQIGAVTATNAATVTDVAVDARKNLLFTESSSGGGAVPLQGWYTARTMLGAPLVPDIVGTSVNSSGIPTGIAIAPDIGVVWQASTLGGIAVNVETPTAGFAGIGFIPLAFFTGSASRIFYNQTAGVMVVTSPNPTSPAATAQIGLYDANTRLLNALFLINNTGVAATSGTFAGAPFVTPATTSIWNGVTTIRQGASGAARAFVVYDDPSVAGLPDNLGSLSFSTGVINAVVVAPGSVTAANITALAYDSSRALVVWWHAAPLTIEKRDPVTLAVATSPPYAAGQVFSAATAAGSNFVSISTDVQTPGSAVFAPDDRYFACDNATGGGTLLAIRGLDLTSAGVVIAGAGGTGLFGGNASTSP